MRYALMDGNILSRNACQRGWCGYSEAMPNATTLDPKLLALLVCPVTHGPLEYDEKAEELISRKAGLAFPVREGIPILLAEEARPLEKSTS